MKTTPRKARATVLSGLLFVVLVHLGFNVALETERPGWRDPEYGARLGLLRTLRDEHPERPLAVAIGSSRTQMGLRPDVMGDLDGMSVFNFGIAGCGPLGEWLTLNRILDAGIKPDYLLIEVLPPALHQDGDGSDFVDVSRLSLDDLELLEPYCGDHTGVVRDWCEVRASPICNTRFALVSQMMPSWLPFSARVDYMWNTLDRRGWLPYPHADVTPAKRAEGVEHARVQYKAHMADFHVSPIPDRALRQILDKCREQGITPVLYRMPEGESFREMYPAAMSAEIDEYLAELCRETGVSQLDATAWLSDRDFIDGHHALPAGAESFSRRFAAELARLLQPRAGRPR